jgi:cellulose synthase/poly-beta-1,6-N-acetylglucosamine synthase-like glycosyltransferase
VSEVRARCHGRDPALDGWPTVSVVVPIRNEAPHLERAVASILAQEYPLPFDVCLAVAPSDDATGALAERIAAEHDRVSTVPNPAGVTPAGLNAAIGPRPGRSSCGSTATPSSPPATSAGRSRRCAAPAP